MAVVIETLPIQEKVDPPAGGQEDYHEYLFESSLKLTDLIPRRALTVKDHASIVKQAGRLARNAPFEHADATIFFEILDYTSIIRARRDLGYSYPNMGTSKGILSEDASKKVKDLSEQYREETKTFLVSCLTIQTQLHSRAEQLYPANIWD